MELLERLAEALARDSLKMARETGDEEIVAEVTKALGASSTTMEEAYLSAVRFLRAEARAREVLAGYAARQSKKPPDSGGD